jgi:hypothetical protein
LCGVVLSPTWQEEEMARSISGVFLVVGLAVTLLLLAHQASAHGSHAAAPKSKLQVHQAPPPSFLLFLGLYQLFVNSNISKSKRFADQDPQGGGHQHRSHAGNAPEVWRVGRGMPPQYLRAHFRRGARATLILPPTQSRAAILRCRGAGWPRRARETGSAFTRPPTPA